MRRITRKYYDVNLRSYNQPEAEGNSSRDINDRNTAVSAISEIVSSGEKEQWHMSHIDTLAV